jgi:ectoine hydroxylase-related dioxygenase (phytanoyl-CoA dioxygenase family)
MIGNINIDELTKNLFENGFLHIKKFFSQIEIEMISDAINLNMQNPSPFARKISSDGKIDFFFDYNNWKRIKEINAICRLQKIIELITLLTKSKKCWLFHDNVWVKNKKSAATPVHQDRPYYIFKGDLNLSLWIPVEKLSRKSGIIFYKGSHKSNLLYTTDAFTNGETKKNSSFKDITKELLENYPAVDFDMEPGDLLIFFNKTIHASHQHLEDTTRRSLAIRYLLDGASLTENYINATPPYDRLGIKIKEDFPVPEEFFPLLKG